MNNTFYEIKTKNGVCGLVRYGVEQLNNSRYMAVVYFHNGKGDLCRHTISKNEYKTKAGAERVVYNFLRG